MKVIPTFPGEIGLSLSEEEIKYLFFLTAEKPEIPGDLELQKAAWNVVQGLYAISLKLENKEEHVIS